MIRITVTGDRGEGKTTTAILILKALRDCGLKATYEGETRYQAERVEEIVAGDNLPDILGDMTEEREWVVIDQDRTDTKRADRARRDRGGDGAGGSGAGACDRGGGADPG